MAYSPRFAASLAWALLLWTLPVRALDVPELKARVNDLAGLLTADQRDTLESKLRSDEAVTGHQFALLTVPSLEGEAIEDFSIRVAESWKLGRDKLDDGVLLTIAVNDRKMRIEVGYGLEGELTDAFCASIIRETIAPAFRRGAHAEGISWGFDLLMAKARGVGLDPPERTTREKFSDYAPYILIPLMLLTFCVPLTYALWSIRRARKRRGSDGGGYAYDADGSSSDGSSSSFWSSSDSSSSSWSSDSSSSSDSSGSSDFSGGGGDFGGGGSSGDW